MIEIKVPSELLRATPRMVRLTTGGTATACFGFAMLLGAVLLSAVFYQRATRDAGLVRRAAVEGAIAPGEVVRIRRAVDREQRATVSYQFEVDGKMLRDRTDVSNRAANKLQVGSAVTVHYLRTDPGRNWLGGAAPNATPFWLAPLLFFSLAAPAGLMLFRIHKERYLLTEGRPALATVTGSRRIVGQHGQRFQVRYEFTTLSGKLWKGSASQRRRPAETGSTITVLYDRDEPQRSRPYPFALVRIEE